MVLSNQYSWNKYMLKLTPARFAVSFAVALSAVIAAVAVAAGVDALSAGDAERGAEQFEATCYECHGPAATAPTLRGVIGREVAGDESFDGYSEELKAKKPMKWTKELLDTYLIDPGKFNPGSLMYRRYPDAQMRADVIAYIETLPPPRR